MTRGLVIRPEAEADAIEAASWYEQKSKASAARFVRELRSALEKIINNPLQYQTVEFEMRRAPVAGFPYGILYVVSDEEIVVLSCFHGKRDPARRRERLK
jgi:plasmid stabilization system protein ParE